MTIDTKRLRELAEKATPGPWFAENYATDPYDRTVVYNTFHNGDTMDRDLVAEVAYGNAEFIAATDPQTVLALLDEIERLHARVDSMQMANDMLRATHRTDNQYLLDEIERLRGETEWKWEQPECDWETRTHSINCDCWGPLEQKVRRRVGPWEPVEGDHR